jgi:type 2 lantibiotic biosynthesis protein LanM
MQNLADAKTSDVLDLETAIRLNQEAVIPELLTPLLEIAQRDLLERLELEDWDVTSTTISDLVGWYQQMLARLTNLVILQRFSSFHMVINPLWRPSLGLPGDAPENARRDVLDAYIAWEEIERLLSDDGPYPELGRMLRVTRNNWLAATVELIERVELHRDEIARLVNCSPQSLGSLTGAKFGISDPHEGGRTAAILSFGERKVVYKPRSLDGELSWTAICTQVLSKSIDLPAYSLGIVAADGYGFMEYVEHTSCSSLEQVRRCYQRYGALLAVAHALGTCDLHHENVIVSGEHPVVIDAEPLFRARLAVSEQGEERLKFERNLSLEGLDVRESVLELGILPLIMRSPLPIKELDTQEEYDIGALCAYGQHPIRDQVPCDRGSNNLQMRMVSLMTKRFPNLPALNGKPQFSNDFVDDIVKGFEIVHDFLRVHRDEYIGSGGLLNQFASKQVRLLARPTMEYGVLLARSISPEPLRSSERRLQLLKSDLKQLALQRFDTIHNLADSELASLFDGDIPRFELKACQTGCCDAKLFGEPVESAKTRWRAFDEFDCQLQVTSIRERLKRREQQLAISVPRLLNPLDLEQHGLAIVSAIVDAVRSPESNPYWVYATYAPGFGATMAHADRESLYEGAAGTALVVAEAGRLAGETSWCQLAARIFEPVVRGQPLNCLRRSGGVGRGLGGLVYAMVRVAEASGEEALLDTALRLIIDHGHQLAVEDGLDEVLYGRAGLLLAVTALHKRRPSERLREVADLIADKILSRAVRTEFGTHWLSLSGGPLPNVSHGTAGIAMALARYAQMRDSSVAAEVAHDALAFDDTFWLSDKQGWLDPRLVEVNGEQRTSWSWCNGRSGALLARLAVSEALGTSFNDGFVRYALSAPATDVLIEASPGLCCGTAGAIDALLQLQQHTRHSPISDCLEKAVNTLAVYTATSHYSTLTASLFAGTSGFAFGLLRAARPSEVDSVLWFG